ncbi:MAG: hypothetical protein ABS81_01820 [Pseudonocardia sp. SCN 72-86]|nr:MAG: hypothetical protein ABS81_01820 [Pseudonocardia sp. SCN 72-86]
MMAAACSTTGGSSTSDAGGADCNGSAQAATDAKAAADRVTTYMKPPATLAALGLTQQVAGQPARGKSITYVGNEIPIVLEVFNGMKEAAAAVGWNASLLQAGNTTAGAVDAMNKIVQSTPRPDGVVLVGIRLEQVQEQVATLRAAGVPVIVWGGSVDQPSPTGYSANIVSPDFYSARVRAETDWLIADSGGCAHIGFFLARQFPVNLVMLDAMKSALATNCHECTLDVKDVQVTDIGSRMPAITVGYLQSKPDIDYLYTSLGGAMWAGVPQAMDGAGLSSKVKLTTDGADATTFQDIVDGRQALAADQTPIQLGWHLVDSFIRAYAGEEVQERLPIVLIDKSNVGDKPDPSSWGVVPGFRDQYRSLWNVTQ